MKLDWYKLRRLTEPPELTEMDVAYSLVKSSLYRFSGCEYALAPRQMGRSSGKMGNYVNSFIWAPDFSSVRGLFLADPGSDSPRKAPLPSELMIEAGMVSFADIRKAGESGRHGRFAVSSGAARRACLFEETIGLLIERLYYYFSSPGEEWDQEEPILVELRTSENHWIRLETCNQ